MTFFGRITTWLTGRHPDQFGDGRSPRWRHVRAAHLALHPCCLACGGNEGLEVHHICDFSTYPELELEPDNLVTLCGKGCHLKYGHRGNWRRINPSVTFDCLVARLADK